MEYITLAQTDLKVSRIALGTWAIGGWMWGGSNELQSIDTIHAALDRGINLIDSAPVYGFGRSEEIIGKALKDYGSREKICISTKAGLEWQGDRVFRNSQPTRIAFEVEDSLCRGFLSGKMSHDRQFKGDDLRAIDPKFQAPRFSQYLEAAKRIEQLAHRRYEKELLPAAVRWILDQGVDIAIWGGRRPDQMDPVSDVFGWSIDADFNAEIDRILSETVMDPVQPDFMAPPTRQEVTKKADHNNLEEKL